MKSESVRISKQEEEKSQVSLGGKVKGEVNLSEFIKGEYLMSSPFLDIKVPSKVEIRIPAHK